ncbi:MAG TPA: nitroreductase family deazaflavin-dependent oxidoreductase [Baekduia sp.]|uniref:nitroreductase family deazaflavin-dependent oxidoreductase n=1 Tax=Baekduia sp. TaxID=2600305 RepID=UPI002D774EE5|nr:nitroreductase family deazaflavin-dependent oxidoreductase [Baekduia sp.]HET6509301.1 nitroreductase family deazaflavin-dependent oxidoreductase [Baekduia sp.]
MTRSKGLYGRITSAARPPRPGSPAFWAWNRITAANTFIYKRTGGRLGASFDGAPTLLLHHVGAKSGQERVAPLLYLPDGDALVIVASWGGSPKNPAWFHNLKANPETTVQVGRERRPVTARVADAGERARLWPELIDLYPAYGDYQARTGGREIPLVILERRA